MLAKKEGAVLLRQPLPFCNLTWRFLSALYPLGHHKPRISFSLLLDRKGLSCCLKTGELPGCYVTRLHSNRRVSTSLRLSDSWVNLSLLSVRSCFWFFGFAMDSSKAFWDFSSFGNIRTAFRQHSDTLSD